MIHLHLTADDLLRVRFASAPSPFLEMSAALAALQRRDALFEGWRRGAHVRLPRSARQLFQLVPAAGTGPMFLDPVSEGLDDGLQFVRSASRGLVHSELLRITAAGLPVTPWLRGLDDGDPDAWQLLTVAIRAAHATLIEPVMTRIWQSFRSEVAWRTLEAGESGLQAALGTLHPALRWNRTTLEIDAEPELSIRPDGAGITLHPSAFWTGRPLLACHPDGSTIIVYPSLTALPLTEAPTLTEPLAELLGRTRAAVLRLATTPRTTGQLAGDLGISAASASEHARTLRAAGLITTRRAGKAVLHSLTPLGVSLLAQNHHYRKARLQNGTNK